MRFAEIIQGLDEKPGVYFMLDAKGEPIYIGKALNLKSRLSQYFTGQQKLERTARMLSHVVDVKVIITQSESAALMLENEMIKKHQPTYNILLKDDKSHPYIQMSKHDFPQMRVVRFKKQQLNKKHTLFGPYPHVDRANKLIDWMQRIFHIRNCSDHFFSNRVRPCLQYEIGRCSAPCVDYISKSDYQKDVKRAVALLSGKGQEMRADLMRQMYAFSESADYERAAACRDALKTLASAESRRVTEKQRHVYYYELLGNTLHLCIAKFVGNIIDDVQHELIAIDDKCMLSGWLLSYVLQYYSLYPELPDELILQTDEDLASLKENLVGAKSVSITALDEKKDAEILDVIHKNMQQYRRKQTTGSLDWTAFWQSVSEFMGHKIDEILCLDVSHHQGGDTYASCVIVGPLGVDRKRSRVYKVNANGDDYLGIKLALEKRIKRHAFMPSCLYIIDGGKGQIAAAASIFGDQPALHLTSIAKGRARIWGKEHFFRWEAAEAQLFKWPPELMRTILYIRDQAHDMAITAHRRAARKTTFKSQLDQVSGLGEVKKKLLLGYFGGLGGVKAASLDDLKQVPQIGPKLAQRIYDWLRL